MRTSAAVDLYNRLKIIALTATDLPEPVVPATSRCGIAARLTTTGDPPISLPNAIETGDLNSSYRLDFKISLKRTISRLSFGISSPIEGLPGITSTIRTLMTDKARAKSFANAVTLLTFTPAASNNSKRVTTGPGCTSLTSASILKSNSFSSTCLDKASNAASE